jgi:hypothetical protein
MHRQYRLRCNCFTHFIIEEQKRVIGQHQRIFVNVPSSTSIAVVSSEKHTVSTTWLIVNAKITFQWL